MRITHIDTDIHSRKQRKKKNNNIYAHLPKDTGIRTNEYVGVSSPCAVLFPRFSTCTTLVQGERKG